MSVVQHIILFVVASMIWIAMTSYFSPSRFKKLIEIKTKTKMILEKEEENLVNFLQDGPFGENHVVQMYKKLYHLSQFTTSSKSKIEYDRSIGILKLFVNEYKSVVGKLIKLPSFSHDQKKIVQTSADICPEKTWDLTDQIFQKPNKHSEWHTPLWIEPPLLPGCKAPPLNDIVTILFNFASEIPISKAKTLFLDVADCRYKNMHMISLIRDHDNYEKIRKLAADKLPNMQVIDIKNTKRTQAADLLEAVSHIKTNYVIFTRNTERFDNFSVIIRLVRDVSVGNSVITGSTQRNISGHWKSGCYQVKQRIDEIHFEEGYDQSEDGCMVCDYLSTPFGTKTEFALNYLKANQNTVLNGDAFYLELFMKVKFEMKKKTFMCVDSMFYTETSGIQTKNKKLWLPFVKKYGFSKVTVNFPDQRHMIEFKCGEVSLTCSPRETGVNYCCYKEAEEILKVITESLSVKRISYRFRLPTKNSFWTNLKNSPKRIISIKMKGSIKAIMNKIKFNGFSWEKENFVSNDWMFLIEQNSQIVPNARYKIKFGELVLPVEDYPGDFLGNDFMSKCIACFDLFFYYRSLDTQKIWL